MTTRSRASRGVSTAAEAALLIPMIVVLIMVMQAGYRLWQARTDLDQLAGAAARAAALSRSASEAREQVERILADNPTTCRGLVWDSDLFAFALPVGEPGSVRITLRCSVPLQDLGLPGMPGNTEISARASAPLNTYRERRP